MASWSIAGASLSLLLVTIVACGGSATTPTGGVSDAGDSDAAASDGEASDGAPPADGQATDAATGCISQPAEGAACVPGQVSCDRVDLCCASAASCDPGTSKWKLSGNACLLCQTHGCGDKTCQGAEMCVSRAPGVPGGQPTYACAAYPTACAREWTCGCVEKNLPAGCTLSTNGCSDTELPVKISCQGS